MLLSPTLTPERVNAPSWNFSADLALSQLSYYENMVTSKIMLLHTYDGPDPLAGDGHPSVFGNSFKVGGAPPFYPEGTEA